MFFSDHHLRDSAISRLSKRASLNRRPKRIHARSQRFGSTRPLKVEQLEFRRLLTTTLGDVLQFDMGAFAPVEGTASSLTRSENDITLRVSTSGLPIEMNKLSIAGFNNPDVCTGDCDLQTDGVDAGATLIDGAAATVSEDGLAEFNVTVPAGLNAPVLTGPGILDTSSVDDCWMAGLRFEWFRDEDGTRVGLNRPSNPNTPSFAGNFYSISCGVNWTLTDNFVLRPELRADWYEGNAARLPYDDGTDDSQFLLGLDAILLF